MANRMAEKLERYDDIAKEFHLWLADRTFEHTNPVVVSGYTAQEIHRMNPSFDGAGVYNFMVTMREKPDIAKEIIAAGFPTK